MVLESNFILGASQILNNFLTQRLIIEHGEEEEKDRPYCSFREMFLVIFSRSIRTL